MNRNLTPKERGLIKGALRRVFARSDLRREVLAERVIKGYTDPNRARVKKWALCVACNTLTPAYLIVVDHIDPIVPVHRSLEEMTWDELIDRLWCAKENLAAICKSCHLVKTKRENKERAIVKKMRKMQAT